MKKIIISIAALLLTFQAFCQVSIEGEVALISSESMSILLDAKQGSPLKYLYIGDRIAMSDADQVVGAGAINTDAYPVYGEWNIREDALAVTHGDGNMTLQMGVSTVRDESTSDASVLRVTLKDYHYDFSVDVLYKAFKDSDVIETWTEISHAEKKPVLLRRFDSAYIPIRVGDVWVSHLYGTWANEARLVQEPLERGTLKIENKDGIRNSHTSHAEVMFSLDGKPAENEGRVLGAALCYGGNYLLEVVTDDTDYHHFSAGIHCENASYSLPKGEVFRTPELALTWSSEGLGAVSRHFHKWARRHRLAHGDKERKILLNSWEGVYFNINEEGMDRMMSDISSMGGELFVMDDGWFGDKYPRLTDNSSLGDWVVDTRKLPHGIQWLVDAAGSHGIRFGIWIEPEMANTASELYEKHPDWIINAGNREVAQGRGGTQVVLDLSNPAVQDHVYGVVDELLGDYPDIDYIKWDANMPVQSHGSHYLAADSQGELDIRYWRGFAAVCDRIRAKYPDVTIQCCASGGGRANFGVLPWFDEFWVSDNTDALQRIYMQWGTSYFFPAIAMASHISAVPNHTVQRVTPLKYRIDVAMSGRLGMELQPKDMTAAEIEQCRTAIAEYKQIRPVVQFGDLYRLVSPYDGLGLASLMYVSDDKDEAVFYWWRTENFYDTHLPRVRMAGLDPGKRYKVVELDKVGAPLSFEGKTFTGEFLMNNGLEMPNTLSRELQGYSSRVIRLIAE